ncbi:uncharacterized protein LOC119732340 [Patiria miniata]|uniref:Nucleotide-diphospho-sugar transferase domain-containing protein n=1 Tax=Patiria miniata TaxID=46514 RepID=A0A914ACS7_PATMI|nr:uncharacterized protein LOC119732340 [Patiria miniata]
MSSQTLLYMKLALSVLIVLCAAIVGYHVFMKQDYMEKSLKQVPTEVTRDPDDVRLSGVIPRNSSTVERKLIKDIDNESRDIDTGQVRRNGVIEEDGIDERMIDLVTADPRELMNRTVIVNAISQNHLKESMGMIASVQEFLPNTRIVMYNLGLNTVGIQQVKRLCNVELRSFNFAKYPPHVRNLHTYAWKPLIIQETLDEFGVMFWCDASARFQQDPLVLFSLLKEQQGFMRRIMEFKSNKMLVRTHPKMFKALGIDREQFRADAGYAMCFEANRLLFVNSALVRTKIIGPWVDCAMNMACIAPKGSVLAQNQKGPQRYTHRFDQAALALVAYKNTRGIWNANNDRSELFHEVVGLSRSAAGSEKAQFCKS